MRDTDSLCHPYLHQSSLAESRIHVCLSPARVSLNLGLLNKKSPLDNLSAIHFNKNPWKGLASNTFFHFNKNPWKGLASISTYHFNKIPWKGLASISTYHFNKIPWKGLASKINPSFQ